MGIRFIGLVLVLGLGASCTPNSTNNSGPASKVTILEIELADAKTKWQASRAGGQYSVTYQDALFSEQPFDSVEAFINEQDQIYGAFFYVSGGQTTQSTDLEALEPLLSVEEMFALIESYLNTSATLEVTFDDFYGNPKQISISGPSLTRPESITVTSVEMSDNLANE